MQADVFVKDKKKKPGFWMGKVEVGFTTKMCRSFTCQGKLYKILIFKHNYDNVRRRSLIEKMMLDDLFLSVRIFLK